MKDEKNQLYVLAGLFVCVIVVPAVVIYNVKEQEDTGIDVHPETYEMLPRGLMQQIDKMLSKKGKGSTTMLSDNAWADIYQESIEFLILAHKFKGKINFRNFVKTRAEGQKISEKFAAYESEIEDKLPKLTRVLIEHIAKPFFRKELEKFAGDEKVKLTVGDVFHQTYNFTDKIMRMGQNGYEGYKLSVEQKVETDKNLKKIEKVDGDYQITFDVTVDHKDWLSIKGGESEETFSRY